MSKLGWVLLRVRPNMPRLHCSRLSTGTFHHVCTSLVKPPPPPTTTAATTTTTTTTTTTATTATTATSATTATTASATTATTTLKWLCHGRLLRRTPRNDAWRGRSGSKCTILPSMVVALPAVIVICEDDVVAVMTNPPMLSVYLMIPLLSGLHLFILDFGAVAAVVAIH